MSTPARLEKLTASPKNNSVQEAIIFVSRPAVRPVVKQELKAAGIAAMYTPETPETCVEQLGIYSQAMLVVDWDLGLETLNLVLRAAQGLVSVDTRPIFLMASEVSRDIVAVGAEYNVARVHTGEITRGAIQGHIEAILAEESSDVGMRSVLSRVAEARQRKQWATASSLLQDLQRRYPDHRRLNCEIVENLINEEKWEQASAIVDTLAVTDFSSLRVQHLKSRCLMKQGHFDAAAALLESCQLVNPYNVDRLVDLGRALLHCQRYKDALKRFDAALVLDPKSTVAVEGSLQCRLMEGDVNQALHLMRQISSPREFASLFNNSAILAIRQGHYEQGLNLYKTAIGSIETNDKVAARLMYNLGLAYHKWGRAKEALEYFERALKIDPQFAAARHNANILAAVVGKKIDPKAAAAKVIPIEDVFDSDFLEEKFQN